MGTRIVNWLEVFNKQVKPRLEVDGDCWLFVGSSKNGTHGDVKVGGRRGSTVYVHQVAYRAFKGLEGPGELVMHNCNMHKCCNPAHLKAGTQSQNMQYWADTGGRRTSVAEYEASWGHVITEGE